LPLLTTKASALGCISYAGDVQLDDYLAAIATEGNVMADAAGQAGLDAVVPTCPGWLVRDAVLHTGEVHRWATAIVRMRLTSLDQVPEDFLGALPDDADALDWFRAGVTDLIAALRNADPSVAYACFFENPITPHQLFWARRQAQEIGMHRVDVEYALGRYTPFAPEFAADGIDEFLCGFVSRKRTRLTSASPRTLAIAPTDTNDRWLLAITDAAPRARRTDDVAGADCVVAGTADHLYRALWNRGDVQPLTINGDSSVLALVRDSVHIR
jgi:uncharacterized protein (TIGR03083 family)